MSQETQEHTHHIKLQSGVCHSGPGGYEQLRRHVGLLVAYEPFVFNSSKVLITTFAECYIKHICRPLSDVYM